LAEAEFSEDFPGYASLDASVLHSFSDERDAAAQRDFQHGDRDAPKGFDLRPGLLLPHLWFGPGTDAPLERRFPFDDRRDNNKHL